MAQSSGNNPIFRIGIDIGFGDVKAVAIGPNGSGKMRTNYLKFPSYVARAGRIHVKGLDNVVSHYSYDGKEWLLGNSAAYAERTVLRRDVTFLLEFAPLFVFKIMEGLAAKYQMDLRSLLKEPKIVGVGLPLEYFFDHRQSLLDRLVRFDVSGRQVILEDGISVFAQGQGVQFDFLISNGKTNQTWKRKTIAVLDVGYNTIDFLAVNNGCADPENSEMISQKGVCRLCVELRHELKQAGVELSEYGILKALCEGKAVSYGQTVDLTEMIPRLAEEYADELFTEVSTRFGRFLPKTEKLVLAGGGAYLVRKHFIQRYSESFVHVPARAKFSNARGYMKFLEIR